MGREQVLLKEYEACQQHMNTLGTQNWQSAGIFLAADALITGFTLGLNPHDRSSFIAVLAIGIVMILVFHFWRLWLKRQLFIQITLYTRMRNIEDELGMWKSWYGFLPDELNSDEKVEQSSLPKEIKETIKGLRKHHSKPWGYRGLICMAHIIAASWIVLMFREACLVFNIPFFSPWLTN